MKKILQKLNNKLFFSSLVICLALQVTGFLAHLTTNAVVAEKSMAIFSKCPDRLFLTKLRNVRTAIMLDSALSVRNTYDVFMQVIPNSGNGNVDIYYIGDETKFDSSLGLLKRQFDFNFRSYLNSSFLMNEESSHEFKVCIENVMLEDYLQFVKMEKSQDVSSYTFHQFFKFLMIGIFWSLIFIIYVKNAKKQ